MENFVVAEAAVKAAKRKRVTHPPERIEKAVGLARQVGPLAAASAISRSLTDIAVSADTVRFWLARWKTEGKFWETVGKRGRPSLAGRVPGATEEFKRQVDSFRAQGESVTGRVASTILRAVVEEKAPSLLERHGGPAKISVRAAANFLSEQGLSFRKRSSSRIIPPSEDVVNARDTFFANTAGCFPGQAVDTHLVINFDQTFHLYSPTRGYTWEKKGADRVQLAQNKDGFTLTPVVSMAGVVGAQLIFSGSTSTSLPRVTPGPLLHFTQTSNHWSNEATTLQLWRNVIFPHVAARRNALHAPSAPVIVLADAFAAHWTPAVQALVATDSAIAYLCVPASLTHVFQPLDLGIIAAIKQSVLRRKDEFSEEEVRTAIRENRGIVLSKSRPILRDRITIFIKETLADPVICAEHCCRSGFDRSGVTRALYGDSAIPPDVDSIVPPLVCTECGEPAFPHDTVPQCACFDVESVLCLCRGCFRNHDELCPRDD